MTTPPDDHPSTGPSLRVALLGADYPGLRIRTDIDVGDAVTPGQIIFRDAKRPEITFASPIKGRVTEIEYGPRRMLSCFMIEGVAAQAPPVEPTGDIRAQLLARGLWPAFVTRPFGGPPDPAACPDAIVVLATPTSPSAPDPSALLATRQDDFETGLTALTDLTDRIVHVTAARGFHPALPTHPRIRLHHRRFGRLWRTKGEQVAHALGRTRPTQVWMIGYQDVSAIGQLLRTGTLDTHRTVALTQPGQMKPDAVQMPLGSDLQQIFGTSMGDHSDLRTISGPEVQHRWSRFLGRHDDEAALARDHSPRPHKHLRPLIPFNALERALPFGVPTVPLMRALAVGDPDTCARLGCLDLLEDDVAHLSGICSSGTNYAGQLREMLNRLRKDMAL